jgi:hypothetical protein
MGIVLVALLGYRVAASRAAERHVIAAGLIGHPQVGCLVAIGGGQCAEDWIRGTAVPDGETTFAGRFAFHLPGLRGDDGALLRRAGRGRLEGTFTPAGGPGRHCVLKGRVRTQGVSLPAGASTLRFHTGTFAARGHCDGERVRLKAIWSGAIDAGTAGEMVFDFERFQGKLAGQLLLP